MAERLRMVMYGIGHSHSPGKYRAMCNDPSVDVVGVCEPDAGTRDRVEPDPAFEGAHWIADPQSFLADPSVNAVCVEGDEGRCSALALECIRAGKHLWYDKPAGDAVTFRTIIATARARSLKVQMGYMLRYVEAFVTIGEWVHAGVLGHIFSVRGHMSTTSSSDRRGHTGYPGGIAFQLGPHMIDQVLWILGGGPDRITAFLRNDATSGFPAHADNTLIVMEYPRAIAMIDIAEMESSPPARRFEVYGTSGSAIVVEPFEPGTTVRLCLSGSTTLADGRTFAAGEHHIPMPPTPRTISFPRELAAFVRSVQGHVPPDRTLDHELLVEETLHRAIAAG